MKKGCILKCENIVNKGTVKKLIGKMARYGEIEGLEVGCISSDTMDQGLDTTLYVGVEIEGEEEKQYIDFLYIEEEEKNNNFEVMQQHYIMLSGEKKKLVEYLKSSFPWNDVKDIGNINV